MSLFPLPPEVSELILAWAIEVVKVHGYRVELGDEAGDWIAPADLRRAIAAGMDDDTFNKRLNSPEAPPFIRRRGPKGRLTKLRPHAALIAWLTRPLAEEQRR